MRTDYITPEAWNEVETRYPSAYHILLKSSLETEKENVKRELGYNNIAPMRRKWLEGRLADLTHFDKQDATPA